MEQGIRSSRLFALVLALAGAPAWAQGYPAKPFRLLPCGGIWQPSSSTSAAKARSGPKVVKAAATRID
jgi:hypothetical protein